MRSVSFSSIMSVRLFFHDVGNVMGHVIKFFFSIVFVALIAAFYALLHIDLNDYKQQIEEAASDATGRQLHLVGDVSIAWSLIPTLIIEKATFSNAEWGSKPDMVSLDKFEVRLALYPLLKREIQVTKILLNGPRILIETNKKGVGNWVFGSRPVSDEAIADEGSLSIESIIVHEFDIEQAHIHYIDGVTGDIKEVLIDKLSVDVADLEQPIDILINAIIDEVSLSMEGRVGGAQALIDNKNTLVDLNAELGGVNLSLEGTIAKPHEGKGATLAIALTSNDSALSALSSHALPTFGEVAIKGDIATDMSSDNVTLDLSGMIKDFELLLKGHINKPQQAKGIALDIDLQTTSSALALLSGSELPKIGDINMKGSVSNDIKTDKLTLDLRALAEGLDFSVKGSVLRPQEGDGIALDLALTTNSSTLSVLAASDLPPLGNIKLTSALSGEGKVYQLKRLNLMAGDSDVTGDVMVSLVNDKPDIVATLMSKKIDLTVLDKMEKTVKAEPVSEQVFSDEPLVFDALKQLDAKVTFEVQAVNTSSITLNQVDVGVDLQKGHLRVKPLDAGFAGSKLTGHLDLNTENNVAVLDTKMQVNGFKLSGIKALEETISGGNTDMYFQAKADGETVRKMMAGLNGKAIIKVGKSNIADGTLDLLGADFIGELVGMLNPFSKEEKGTQLACAVINFNIKDGIATAKKGIAIQTDKLNIVGDGTINLKNEKIKIAIKPEARTGIGINISQLAGLVKVGGTLARPAAQVDQAAVLAAGVSGAAAVATGGLSVVAQGLANRGTADADPCKTALGE